MSYPENCIIKKGFFPDTTLDVDDKFAFVRIDVDLYTPTKAGIEWFEDRLLPGGIVIIDDYYRESYSGVKAAVDEYMSAHMERKMVSAGDGASILIL